LLILEFILLYCLPFIIPIAKIQVKLAYKYRQVEYQNLEFLACQSIRNLQNHDYTNGFLMPSLAYIFN